MDVIERDLESTLRERLQREGLVPRRWATQPHTRYEQHAHPYHKTLVVVSGSITFSVRDEAKRILMTPGDRLELPANTPHRATVGAIGVVCLEAHRA